ncbi:sensor histidine kinase [Gilvibacter sediminis]|uniref:sensor histidine kinase n=1 Tax=Gilvibacter sediminis TaxID=379071 RepID=UPI0023506FC8|nr:histidine kinase [Gilvibacter sediminis]MDC7998111.1 histidine kinase [Gilvibacter sediminis]
MQTPDQQIYLIIYVAAVLLIIVVVAIRFFSVFIHRKNKLVLENLEAEQKFEQELANSRLEIQEQTFKNIAWELHDNVGQLLSVANIQLNMLESKLDEEDRPQLEETKGIVGESLREIRNLSRSLNKEVILNDGLVNSIKREMQRFNRMNFINATLNIDGEECCINAKDEIIIYRILQEFFSNVIKHAKADNLLVHLNFESARLLVNAQDDGIGFDASDVRASNGLLNMKSRAALINAELTLNSQQGKGVSLTLEYPFKDYDRQD